MDALILALMIAGGMVMLFMMLKDQIGSRPGNGNDDDDLMEHIRGDKEVFCDNWFYCKRSGVQD